MTHAPTPGRLRVRPRGRAREEERFSGKSARSLEATCRTERLSPLVTALRAGEARKAVLLNERKGLPSSPPAAPLEQDPTGLAAGAREFPRPASVRGRRVFQTLLVDRLDCAPFRAGAAIGYRFAGAAPYWAAARGRNLSHQ